MPGKPDIALASMGIYVFSAKYLFQLLEENIAASNTDHDFGKDIIPRVVTSGRAIAHPFGMSCVTSDSDPNAPAYWRDVGTVDAYWAANLDHASTIPELDLYDRKWPIWTNQEQLPPGKFVRDLNGQQGAITNLLVCGGCVISGSQVSKSVFSSAVRVHSFCNINDAVLLPQVTIGPSCRLQRVVIDRGCTVPEGLVIGEDPEYDAERFFRTENGITLVTQDALRRLSER
jgi:glucose-1-phosphate adenylyltransferase